MKFNSQFPVLSTVAKILGGIGWLLVIGSVLMFGYTVVEANIPGHYWGNSDKGIMVVSIILFLLGLMIEALAEIIGVLFAIEMNTRK